ncbi:hypothetical protein EV356DRAFT_444122 [Viridothelium virens]|uniref:RRM domain-containing protein n=1 Tax=Viridothelium virens TaxID=1048519 RepID=A0A6A6HDM5_VIRVR|nr:hypothetical protein EV356DRAFT_444122 [Viridothelium virens]
MAGGPSPKDTSPGTGLGNASFTHAPFNSSSSPPKQPSNSQFSDVFAHNAGPASKPFHISPIGDRGTIDRAGPSLWTTNEIDPAFSSTDMNNVPTIFLRKLPRSTGQEALRSMLLFAKDLIDTQFVEHSLPEDKDFLSAVARFKTTAGANEAKERLNGKPNAANDANMVVEVYPNGMSGQIGRRGTVDGTSTRQPSNSTSPSASSSGQGTRQSSRFNGTFQSMEKLSPPNSTPGLNNGEFPVPDANSHFQSLFSPQSPLSNTFRDQPRITGKSVINDDLVNDETDELLKDPVAYAKSGQSNNNMNQRRFTNPQIPISRFSSLSLNTETNGTPTTSPPLSTFTSPRVMPPIQSPNSALSPGPMSAIGPNSNYQLTPQHYQRHNYPPINPADQNPPCNTLYVGNLPIDTSEDELKAMFSKQRGYKRLCFRTKQNGPMCFVEFEDVSFATKALNELYGHPLHNSVKGGIRLSFSKNPLGVRTGQANSMNPITPMSPRGGVNGMGNAMGGPPGFSTAAGPPPGLAAPPGLGAGTYMNGDAPSFGTGMGGIFGNPGFGSNMGGPMRAQPVGGIATTVAGGPGFNAMGAGHNDYMMGR